MENPRNERLSLAQKSEFDDFSLRYEADLEKAIPSALRNGDYYSQYKIDFISYRQKNNTPNNILDFGCGVGLSLPHIRERYPRANLWGYDVSQKSLSIASSRLENCLLTANEHELPKGSFDCILAANVFHHIPIEERAASLSFCRSLLTTSGTLFLFEHNPINPITRKVFEECPFDKDAKMLPLASAKLLAQESGFRIRRSSYTLFFPKQLKAFRSLEKFLAWFPLGAQYCVEMVI